MLPATGAKTGPLASMLSTSPATQMTCRWPDMGASWVNILSILPERFGVCPWETRFYWSLESGNPGHSILQLSETYALEVSR